MSTRSALLLATLLAVPPGLAQGSPDPAATIAVQRDALKVFAPLDGVWRGPAWTILPSGQKHTVTQTERIGPFLDGSVKVVEGRGYDPDGRVAFNAFGIISYNTRTKSYSMHSYAQGNAGDFAFKPTPDGYVWEIPGGRHHPLHRYDQGRNASRSGRPHRRRQSPGAHVRHDAQASRRHRLARRRSHQHEVATGHRGPKPLSISPLLARMPDGQLPSGLTIHQMR